VEIVNNRLKSFINNLKQPIHQLATMSNTIKHIGNIVRMGQIPVGCKPSCCLGVPNPLATLIQTWNDCLTQCSKQLTAILIDYHSQTHEKLLNKIQAQIQHEFNDILNTYNHQIPELTSKLTHTDSKIQALIKQTEDQIANYRKWGNTFQQDPS